MRGLFYYYLFFKKIKEKLMIITMSSRRLRGQTKGNMISHETSVIKPDTFTTAMTFTLGIICGILFIYWFVSLFVVSMFSARPICRIML